MKITVQDKELIRAFKTRKKFNNKELTDYINSQYDGDIPESSLTRLIRVNEDTRLNSNSAAYEAFIADLKETTSVSSELFVMLKRVKDRDSISYEQLAKSLDLPLVELVTWMEGGDINLNPAQDIEKINRIIVYIAENL